MMIKWILWMTIVMMMMMMMMKVKSHSKGTRIKGTRTTLWKWRRRWSEGFEAS
jgi:hypothetical protein